MKYTITLIFALFCLSLDGIAKTPILFLGINDTTQTIGFDFEQALKQYFSFEDKKSTKKEYVWQKDGHRLLGSTQRLKKFLANDPEYLTFVAGIYETTYGFFCDINAVNFDKNSCELSVSITLVNLHLGKVVNTFKHSVSGFQDPDLPYLNSKNIFSLGSEHKQAFERTSVGDSISKLNTFINGWVRAEINHLPKSIYVENSKNGWVVLSGGENISLEPKQLYPVYRQVIDKNGMSEIIIGQLLVDTVSFSKSDGRSMGQLSLRLGDYIKGL